MVKNISTWPTGSNYICNPPVEDTDIDTVVLVEDLSDALQAYSAEGWTYCGKDYEANMLDWFAVRKGKENHIVMKDLERFQHWITATELCRALNLLKKQDRILVFNTIVDGNRMF